MCRAVRSVAWGERLGRRPVVVGGTGKLVLPLVCRLSSVRGEPAPIATVRLGEVLQSHRSCPEYAGIVPQLRRDD